VSISGETKRPLQLSPAAPLQRMRANAARYFMMLGRKPRCRATPPWRTPARLAAAATITIALIAATMILADSLLLGMVQRVPLGVIAAFDWFTDFGKSVWFLVPIALALVAIATLASPRLPLMSQRLLVAVAVRLGFLFVAIGLPGLVFTILKRLIGRARPLVEGSADPFVYRPLNWSVQYASFPSGHATDAFAIATAIGVLWPWTRWIMWPYALGIAVSRVVVTAHFPSDVIAGAVVGVVGALLVREWFAARGFAFVLRPDGGIRPPPRPSWARINRVARQLVTP
jgi:undecaprenyl-diphosphatase